MWAKEILAVLPVVTETSDHLLRFPGSVFFSLIGRAIQR